MKTQQRVTMQPAFGTRFYVPKNTGKKLLANVEEFAIKNTWEKPPSKEEALIELKNLCSAIMEHNSNPVNHVLDNSKRRITNIFIDKLCTSTRYQVEINNGDQFLLNPGRGNAHETLKKIQKASIAAKKMTEEEKAQKFMARVQPSKIDSVINFVRGIFGSTSKTNKTV